MEHEERLKAALADRYPIEREIGSGGMATVDLARDLRHEREVAVKVFQPELAAALGSERFLREIKITAGLSHPHILPLLDSGEADSFLFYVMPYVDGESLREKLGRERELAVDEAVRITEQVAGALGYAHSRGIVHRDLKPENILLQSGQVVVADFGIALALDSAGGARLTETGLSIGTPAYMSPEQVAGEKEIDARSDIYSLGCMLYEMLAGDPPFIASHPRAVLAKHLTDPAPPVTTVRPGVSRPIAATIAKALEKAPADRFETAEHFATALVSDVAVEEESPEKSIVVLPFANLSPDPEAEYFSDGLTEEIITDLSKLSALRVISRSSSMQLKGANKTPEQASRELGVQYALEGSVRRAGDRLRITAQLTDGDVGKHIWAERFDGTMEDVFGIQETVARSIVDALKLSLTPEEDQSLADRPFEDVQSYEWYLMARREMWRSTPEGFERARRHLENGIEISGENPILLEGLADLHLTAYEVGIAAHEESLQEVEKLASRIFVLRPDAPHSHYLLGRIERFRGSVVDAVGHWRRALAIDPSHPGSLSWLFHSFALQTGRLDEAEPLMQTVLGQDPLNPLSWISIMWYHWMRGDLEKADSALLKFRAMTESEVGWTYVFTAYLRMWQNRQKEALDLADILIERGTPGLETEWGKFLKCAIQGDGRGAVEALSDDSRLFLWNDPETVWMTGSGFALAGQKEEALDWLEHAVNRGWTNYPLFAEQDPMLESVRGEERFKKLMKRVRQEWEALGT